MRMRGALVALGTAAALLVPAVPAAAQRDCQFAGPYVVDDAVDCVYLILSLIDWPPR